MTEVTSATWGSDGTTTTNTYTMPAQTTPFVPPLSSGETRTDTTDMPESCSLSVYCRSLSHYVYSLATAAHNPHPLDGQHCLAVQATPSYGQQVGYNEGCWPSNYFALFNNEWGDLNGAPRTRNEGSYSTAAFPGGNCLAGWTTACTTTITGSEGNGGSKSEYPQAWCCPPGQWSCATATGDGDQQAPQRLCQSFLTGTTTTNIWMYWDPPFDSMEPDGSTSSLFEAYTWTADVPAETDTAHAATVFRKVFPLVLSKPKLEEALPTAAEKDVGSGRIVTETATTSVPSLQGRAESGPSVLLSGPVVTSRCLAAGLMGAALATVAFSLFGLVVLYRRGRDRTRREAAVAAALGKGQFRDEKYEEGVLFH
ncbi:hypothetical protein F5Y06DRAFT_190758 [Hypoxylon sp. FL0890]|nr:hypothetical protein F5Y06DRAFT_190758 [Hypoxylon sp. FL0890]